MPGRFERSRDSFVPVMLSLFDVGVDDEGKRRQGSEEHEGYEALPGTRQSFVPFFSIVQITC